LIDTSPEPEDEREEMRRVVYENYNYLDVLYGYYAADMNETWDIAQPIPDMVVHTGDEEEKDDKSKTMIMVGLWRILKECKMVIGDVKVKMPLAVFNRVHVQGQQRVAAMLKKDSSYDVANFDPHYRKSEIGFYIFIETIIRCAYLKMNASGSVSQRLEALFQDHIHPFALKKQTKRDVLDFRSPGVQECLTDPVTEGKLRKVFDYFISSYKSNKQRSNAIGPLDSTMTMNHVLALMEKCNLFDPNYNVKKCTEAYGGIICDMDLLPQVSFCIRSCACCCQGRGTLRARGGEGALAPSCRAPQGHDQTRGDFLNHGFFWIPQLEQNASCDNYYVATRRFSRDAVPQLKKMENLCNVARLGAPQSATIRKTHTKSITQPRCRFGI